MSDSSSVLLQKAIFAVLTADASLIAMVGTDASGKPMIYDTVPPSVVQAAQQGTLPLYIVIGQGGEEWQEAGDIQSEVDGCYCEITKHEPAIVAFGVEGGFVAAKNAVAAARRALMAAYKAKTFSIPDHQITAFDPVRATYSRMDDGITSAGVLTMRIYTQPST